MDTTTPVVPGLEPYEITLGGPEYGQPETSAIAVLRSPEGRVITRWTFTEQERRAITEGADLYVTNMTFNRPFQPLRLEVGSPQPGLTVEAIRRDMRLDDHAELVALSKHYTESVAVAKEAQKAFEEKQREILAPPAESKLTLVQ